jgi:hypothetical protein
MWATLKYMSSKKIGLRVQNVSTNLGSIVNIIGGWGGPL